MRMGVELQTCYITTRDGVKVGVQPFWDGDISTKTRITLLV